MPRVWPYCQGLHQGRCLLRLQQGIALFLQTSRLVEFKTDSVFSRKATLPKTARTRARRPATAAQVNIEFNIDINSRILIAEYIYSAQEKATLPWTAPAARETWTGVKFFLFYIKYIKYIKYIILFLLSE